MFNRKLSAVAIFDRERTKTPEQNKCEGRKKGKCNTYIGRIWNYFMCLKYRDLVLNYSTMKLK